MTRSEAVVDGCCRWRTAAISLPTTPPRRRRVSAGGYSPALRWTAAAGSTPAATCHALPRARARCIMLPPGHWRIPAPTSPEADMTPEPPVWSSPLTPLHFLRRSAAVFADRPAVIYVDRRITYAEFNQRVNR